jgi:EpsI family protein
MTANSKARFAAIAGSKPTRRELLLGGGMLAAAATALLLQPRHRQDTLGSAKLEDLVPARLGRWTFETSSGLVLPPADQLRDRTYQQLLTRVYTRADGAAVMLLIAYGGSQGGMIQVHRPEVCYPASGFRLATVEDQRTALTSGLAIPSRYIVAEGGLRREQLIYWTRLGQSFPRSWSEQKLGVIEENLKGTIPDGVLVRISTVSPDEARDLLGGFAADLFQAVGAHMKEILVGQA